MNTNLVIAVDGPAASGKSTIAQKLAGLLNIIYISTGQMYRAVTYLCLTEGIVSGDIKNVVKIAKQIIFSIKGQLLLINNQDLSLKLKQSNVEKNVASYAQISEVRNILINKQQKMGEEFSVIMDGRDIGSVVFPNATIKFYLDASVDSRAQRRYSELNEKFPENNILLVDIAREIAKRDKMDKERGVSPLIQAKDAIYVDSSELTIEQTVSTIYNIITKKLGVKG